MELVSIFDKSTAAGVSAHFLAIFFKFFKFLHAAAAACHFLKCSVVRESDVFGRIKFANRNFYGIFFGLLDELPDKWAHIYKT